MGKALGNGTPNIARMENDSQSTETFRTRASKKTFRMYLLPYGIPMAIGSIAYFAIAGMLV